jgi:hypothetical protein
MDCAAFFTFSPYGDWLLARESEGRRGFDSLRGPVCKSLPVPSSRDAVIRPRRGTSEGPVLIRIRNRKEMSSSGCFRGKTGG